MRTCSKCKSKTRSEQHDLCSRCEQYEAREQGKFEARMRAANAAYHRKYPERRT